MHETQFRSTHVLIPFKVGYTHFDTVGILVNFLSDRSLTTVTMS